MGDWRNVLHEHSPSQVRVTTFLNSPPPVMGGERYIVGTTPSGPFAGRPNAIATFTGTEWLFDTPEPGWRAYVSALEEEYVFHIGRWQPSILIESKGDLIIGGNSGIPERLPGNSTVGTRKFLSQYQDDPQASLLTTWEQIQYSDISGTPNLSGFIPYTNATTNVNFNAKQLDNVAKISAGINGNVTDSILYVFREGAGSTVIQHIAVDGTGGAAITCRKSRGTLSSPTVPILDDVVGGFVNQVWSGAAWRPIATVRAIVDGTITTTSCPGRIEFQVTPLGGVASVAAAVIKSDGKFGIGTTTPLELLHVAGNGRFDGVLRVIGLAGDGVRNIGVNENGEMIELAMSGTPAGNDNEIQYNLSNDFSSSSNFTYDPDTYMLSVLSDSQNRTAKLKLANTDIHANIGSYSDGYYVAEELLLGESYYGAYIESGIEQKTGVGIFSRLSFNLKVYGLGIGYERWNMLVLDGYDGIVKIPGGVIQLGSSVLLTGNFLNTNFHIPSSSGYYFGESGSNGSWRSLISSSNMVFSTRESGSWNPYFTISRDGIKTANSNGFFKLNQVASGNIGANPAHKLIITYEGDQYEITAKKL